METPRDQPDSPAPNLERRIKRWAWAPDHQFFAATAPGLEEFCAAELAALGMDNIAPEPGGVAFTGRLDAAYQANLWLRTAIRVLLRLADFRVRTWRDLSHQAARIPWDVFLSPGQEIEVQVTLNQSNLKHSGRVGEEVALRAGQAMRDLGLEPPRTAAASATAQRIMVRATDRRAIISLDTSGQHLHRRGYRKAAGPAPLREDLAAGLLALCQHGPDQPLADLMCGAGTLAIEACLMARGLPPGLQRDFAMLSWPAHREATWNHLTAKAAAAAPADTPAPVVARDRSAHTLRAAAANAQRAGVADNIAMKTADFFSTPAPNFEGGLLVLNPPYGKRLGDQKQAENFHRRLGATLRKDYKGWLVGVVLHQAAWADLLRLKERARITVPHGGLQVTMLHGRVPD